MTGQSKFAVILGLKRRAKQMWDEAHRIGRVNPQGKADRLREWEALTTRALIVAGRVK
jgi:hypothetical protein